MASQQVARSNSDDAYQVIRRLIVTVDMPPGTPFTENEMCARVGFGKTPVREALLRLKLEKLVAVQPRTGYRVSPVTLKDVRDTCRMLAAIESLTAERIAATPIVAKRLVSIDQHVDQAVSSEDGWIRADWLFHSELARCQDNEIEIEILARLHQAVMRFRYLALALGASIAAIRHRHDDLIAAIRNGETARARSVVEADWATTEVTLVSLLSVSSPVERINVWGAADDNAFYLDAGPAGPSLVETFEPRLTARLERSPVARDTANALTSEEDT